MLTLQLFQNTGATGFLRQYDLQFEPPTGVDSCDFSRYNLAGDNVAFDVAGPTAVEAVLGTDIDQPFCDGVGPTPTVVGGTVTLAGSVGGRVFVGFTDDSAGRTGVEADAAGAFSAELFDGEFTMDIQRRFPTDVLPELDIESNDPVVVIGSDDDGGDAGPPFDGGGLLVAPLEIGALDPIDLGTFDVPLQDLVVTVVTVDGRPIPGVAVSTPTAPEVTFEMNGFSFTGTSSFPGSPSTDVNGLATLPLLPGTYELRYTPSTGGFVPFTNTVTVGATGSSIQVQLAYPHDPPTAAITPSGTSAGVDTFEDLVTVTVEPEAFDGFDVASTLITVDGGTPTPYTGPFAVTGLGPHTITAQVTDTGSVTGPPVTRTFTIVAGAPPVTVQDPTVPDPTLPDPTVPDSITPVAPAADSPSAGSGTGGGGVIGAGATSPTTAATPTTPEQTAPVDPLDQQLPPTGSSAAAAWIAGLLMLAGLVTLRIARRPAEVGAD